MTRRVGWWLFVVTLFVYLFTAGGSLSSSDGVVAFDVTQNIVRHGDVALSDNLLPFDALRGRDGRYYSPFGIVQSLYNVPFYLAGTAFVKYSGVTAGKPDSVPKAFVALGQTLMSALVVWQTFRLSLALTGQLSASLFAALTLAFASLVWPYSGLGFNQPLTSAALLAAVGLAISGIAEDSRRSLVLSGVFVSLAILTRHELILALVPLALFLWAGGDGDRSVRFRRLIAFGVPAGIGFCIWLAFNQWRFGNPIDTGLYRDPVPGFGSPIHEGLAGLLFSPGASLFLYSPVALLGFVGFFRLYRRAKAPTLLLAAMCVSFICFYSTLGNWLGGRSYGSRYLLIILPYLGVGWAALLSRLRPQARVALFSIVFVIGAMIQVPGVLMDFAKVSESVAQGRGAFTTGERQWSWEASPLVMNTRALRNALPENFRYMTGRAALPSVSLPVNDADRGFSRQFAFSLDVWWLYLFYMGIISAGTLYVVLAAFPAGVTVCIWQIRRALAATSA